MSLFSNAFRSMFSSPKSVVDIINESMRVKDDDYNSFSEGDQIEDSSDEGNKQSSSNASNSHEETRGMNGSKTSRTVSHEETRGMNGSKTSRTVSHEETRGMNRPKTSPTVSHEENGINRPSSKRKQMYPRRMIPDEEESKEPEGGSGDNHENAKKPDDETLASGKSDRGDTSSDEDLEPPKKILKGRRGRPVKAAKPMKEGTAKPMKERTVKPMNERTVKPMNERTAKPMNERTADLQSGEKPRRKSMRVQALAETEESLVNERKRAMWSSVVKKGKPPIRCPYLIEEDEALLIYLSRSDRLSEIKGNVIWQQAETDRATKSIRSWQSMKERLKKYILPELHHYKCISEEDKNRIRGHWNGTIQETSLPLRRGKARNDVSRPKSKKKSKKSTHPKTKVTKVSKVTSSESPSDQEEGNGASSSVGEEDMGRLVIDEDDMDEESENEESENDESENEESKQQTSEDQYLKYVSRVQKRVKNVTKSRAYAKDEDMQLMSLVFNRSKREKIMIQGRMFWQKIETEFEDRTWQSLKERFLKRIIPQLSFYCMEEDMNMRIVQRLLSLDGIVKSAKMKEDILSSCEQVFQVRSLH